MQSFGQFGCGVVGIDPVGVPLAVETERRHHRDDSLVQQHVEAFHVDPFDPSGVTLIDAAEDAGRMRDDRVGIGCPQIDRSQPLENFVRQPHSRIDAHFERRLVGDARAVRVARLEARFFRRDLHLMAGAVDEHDPDAQ